MASESLNAGANRKHAQRSATFRSVVHCKLPRKKRPDGVGSGSLCGNMLDSLTYSQDNCDRRV